MLDRKALFVLGQNLVGLFAGFDVRGLDLLEPLDIAWERRAELAVRRRVVNADHSLDEFRAAQRHCHSSLGPHGMSYQNRLLQALLGDEILHVGGKRGIVVGLIVGAVSMVPQIHAEDVAGQVAGKDLGDRAVVNLGPKKPMNEHNRLL